MTQYQNGTRFELRVKKQLEEDGYLVVRSAGSKGRVDLIAMKQGEHVGIQAKTSGQISPAEWNEFFAACRAAGLIPVIAERAGRALVFWELTGTKIPYARLLPRITWLPDRVGVA